MSQYIQDNQNASKKKILGAYFIGYNDESNTTDPIRLKELEDTTGIPSKSLAGLVFQGITATATTSSFPSSNFDRVADILLDGRICVLNFEPIGDQANPVGGPNRGTLARINAGIFDQAFIDLNNLIQQFAQNNPTINLKDRLFVKFMHEANLSVGAYPWVVFDTANLGQVYDRFTTTEATVLNSITNFKTAFERLANLLDPNFCNRVFELGQDNWTGAWTPLRDFFPSSSSYEVASVNSYNRQGLQGSGYNYSSPIKHNLNSWLRATRQIAPNKLKMLGEFATTSLSTINSFGTAVTISNGGTGFPINQTNQPIPTINVANNGDISPQFLYSTNASGVITAITLANKGEDVTACSIDSAFLGGTGLVTTVNLRFWHENKSQWLRDCGEFLRTSDFDYAFAFLQNKNVSPTDNRDWNLNTARQKIAFGQLFNLFTSQYDIAPFKSGTRQLNMCLDRYTQNISQWAVAGANVGTLSLTTLATNRPYYSPQIQSLIRLNHSVITPAYIAGNNRPYDNRLRYFIPYWNEGGSYNRGYRPNDTITIRFKAMFKPATVSGGITNTNYKAPLIVAIEWNGASSNYDRGQSPQVFLTRQLTEYVVSTSQGAFEPNGYFVSFLIGNTNVNGEFIMTDVIITQGDDEAREVQDLNLLSFLSATSNITATIDNHTINCNNGSSNMTVNLPPAVGINGKMFIVKRDQGSTGVVTVQPSGSSQIQSFTGSFGATTTLGALGSSSQSMSFQSDNINWHLI
jgi:hypothetical protein